MSQDKQAKAANIFDVARLAGVSHQTVSRVLNGMSGVRPATKERVEQAIAQLRYSPSPAARALVTRRTRTIGLITPSISDHGPTAIAMNFNLAARAARYSVDTVISADDDPVAVRAAIEALLRQRVDALVVIVVDVRVLEMVRGLELTIPVVVSASSSRRHPNIVSIDQYRGARAAVRHLAELGHSKILHLAGPVNSPDGVERVRGWRDELVAQRLEVIEPIHGDWTAASGHRIGLEMDVSGVTAIFAANDLLAMGLLSALRSRHLRVPEDISVVGFDDIAEAGYMFPPLTSVHQDFAGLGQLMMQKVLLALEEGGEETSDAPLATRLVVRESTLAPVRP